MTDLDHIQISRNQTAIMVWLRSLGHHVVFVRDYTAPDIDLPPRHKSIGKPCPYCGITMTKFGRTRVTKEHKVPFSRGGRLTAENRLIVCYQCNNDKQDYTPEEWLGRLIAQCDYRAETVSRLLSSQAGEKIDMTTPGRPYR